jgi:hypothetical protein
MSAQTCHVITRAGPQDPRGLRTVVGKGVGDPVFVDHIQEVLVPRDGSERRVLQTTGEKTGQPNQVSRTVISKCMHPSEPPRPLS